MVILGNGTLLYLVTMNVETMLYLFQYLIFPHKAGKFPNSNVDGSEIRPKQRKDANPKNKSVMLLMVQKSG